MAKVWIMSETFSPIAPWNEKQSAANFDEIYDWFTWSNQPISWPSKLLRYYFRHLMACLSPAIIQQAYIIHAATKAPPPIPKNSHMTVLDASTMASSPYPKAVVMLPQSKANMGIAVPIRAAPMVPKKMRILSVLSANRNSSRKDTVFSPSVSFSSFVYYWLSLNILASLGSSSSWGFMEFAVEYLN